MLIVHLVESERFDNIFQYRQHVITDWLVFQCRQSKNAYRYVIDEIFRKYL